MGTDLEAMIATIPLAAYTGTDGTVPVFPAKQRTRILGVDLVCSTTVTGNTTNYSTAALVNKGTDGAGTTTVASKAFTSGVNAAAYDATAITLSTTESALELAAGDVLAFNWLEAGTGLDQPVSLLAIYFVPGYGGGI